MPTYEYRCPGGHVTERFRKMRGRNDPVTCKCGASAERIMSAPLLEPEGVHSHTPNIGRSLEERQTTMASEEYWGSVSE